MATKRLQQAIQYLQDGKKDQARQLIIAEVKDNPDDLSAWQWALEVARNEKEQRTILMRILTLDPSHKGAIQYLQKLDSRKRDMESTGMEIPESPVEKKISRLGGLLRLAVDWIQSLPASCGLFAIFLIVLAGIFLYSRLNSSFFGLSSTNFDDLVISNSYEKIATDDLYWEVQFEGTGKSKYIGTVRHAGPIRLKEFPILTHDILVTTADFADPELVTTNVIDHKFFWKSSSENAPSGTINLIHAIPANQEIYKIMLEAQKWDTVKITGREIFTVKAFQNDGTALGSWQDLGCNTLLVESISLLKDENEN